MSLEYREPDLSPENAPLFDDDAREVHARWQAMSRRQALSGMPYSVVNTGPDGDQMVVVDMPPEVDHDPAEVMAITLPFQQGWKPSMYFRAALTQEIAHPNTRLIVFPSSTAVNPAIGLSSADRERLRGGDYEPIAEQQARYLRCQGVQTLHSVGYSHGAPVGASLARLAADYMDVQTLGAFEAPNIEERSMKILNKAFTKDGWGPQTRAVQRAALPALDATLGVTPLGKARLAKDYAAFGVAMGASLANRAIKAGYTHDTFYSRQLWPALEANPDMRTTLARAEGSGIMTAVAMEAIQDFAAEDGFHGIDYVTVSGYGHEMADNILEHALLVKRAIHGARLVDVETVRG